MLEPSGGDDTSVITNALASGSVRLRGTFSVGSTIAVPSDRSITPDGQASLAWTGAAGGTILDASNSSNVQVERIKFTASDNTTLAVKAWSATDVTVRGCSGNTALIQTSAADNTYANVTDASRATGIKVLDNHMTGTSKTVGPACSELRFSANCTFMGNRVSTYLHGIQFWGGDSPPAKVPQGMNARQPTSSSPATPSPT